MRELLQRGGRSSRRSSSGGGSSRRSSIRSSPSRSSSTTRTTSHYHHRSHPTIVYNTNNNHHHLNSPYGYSSSYHYSSGGSGGGGIAGFFGMIFIFAILFIAFFAYIRFLRRRRRVRNAVTSSSSTTTAAEDADLETGGTLTSVGGQHFAEMGHGNWHAVASHAVYLTTQQSASTVTNSNFSYDGGARNAWIAKYSGGTSENSSAVKMMCTIKIKHGVVSGSGDNNSLFLYISSLYILLKHASPVHPGRTVNECLLVFLLLHLLGTSYSYR